MSRRVAINLFAFLLVFFVMLWWAINNIIDPTRLPLIGGTSLFDQPYEVTGEFAATIGVTDGSEVAYLGVNHGSVRDVEMADDGRVIITMAIQPGKRIPAGSTARIFRKSAVGEPYIDFVPPEGWEDGDGVIEEGDHLTLDETSIPLEFSELLRSASRVLAAVDPEQTRTLVHELAAALDGRSDSLRSLTVNSNAVLETFAQRTELLDSLSENSTRLTATVAERRDDLSTAIDNLADLSETIRAIEPDTQVLLDRGTELLGVTADLVADIDNNLDCILSDLDEVLTVATTDENLEKLERTLYEIPEAFAFVASTLDDEPGGAWLRVHLLLLEPESPPSAYVPHTELPAVPEVPACSSSLASSGVRFQGGSSATGGSGAARDAATLPATGVNTPAAVALLVASAAAFALVARRRADS